MYIKRIKSQKTLLSNKWKQFFCVSKGSSFSNAGLCHVSWRMDQLGYISSKVTQRFMNNIICLDFFFKCFLKVNICRKVWSCLILKRIESTLCLNSIFASCITKGKLESIILCFMSNLLNRPLYLCQFLWIFFLKRRSWLHFQWKID